MSEFYFLCRVMEGYHHSHKDFKQGLFLSKHLGHYVILPRSPSVLGPSGISKAGMLSQNWIYYRATRIEKTTRGKEEDRKKRIVVAQYGCPEDCKKATDTALKAQLSAIKRGEVNFKRFTV